MDQDAFIKEIRTRIFAVYVRIMEILYTVHDVNKTGILALVDEHGYILYFLLSMVHHDCKFVSGGNGNSLHWNINKISLKIFFFQK